MAISAHHGSASLPAAWMEGHGHAQMFGWIGSFILGIGFHSQPARDRSALRIPLTCFSLWTVGVALRWLANIYAWHWRALFPVSAGFELIAVLLFLSAASRHKLSDAYSPTLQGPSFLQQATDVPKPVAIADRMLTACLLRASGLRTLVPVCLEGIADLGMLELSAVLLFAVNLTLTLLLGDSVFAGDSPRQPAVA